MTEAAAVVTAVWVQAPALRPHGEGAILPQRARATIDAGSTVTFPCAPGPAVLIWQAGGVEDQVPILVSDEPEQSLASVVRAARLASGRTADELAALVAQVVRDSSSASAAAGSASSSAESAASARDTAVVARDAAVDARDEAVSAAGAATGAASTAVSARDAAVLARNEAEGYAAGAAASAQAADSAAGRAETAAGSTQWVGDRLTVMGVQSPPLTGPQGPQGPPGEAGDGTGDVLWSELTPVLDGKAAVSHQHAIEDVAGLGGELNLKISWYDVAAPPTGSTVALRTSTGALRVGTATDSDHAVTKAQLDTVDARVDTRKGVIHSGTGNPPSSIPGAVVGDYWLNENDMSLHKITGL